MSRLRTTIFALCTLCCSLAGVLQAQTVLPSPYTPIDDPAAALYDDSVVPRIDIWIAPDDWTQLLSNPNSDTEFAATFIFNNGSIADTLVPIGFGLRGNTSLSAAKKSFKISFNTFTPGEKYKGIEKMNLNGEHNDPAIIRSKLYWDLAAQMGIAAPRANHIALYINNSYFGLYINVEHIDEEFVQNRFGNNNGNLYKCLYPAPLAYLGSNSDAYKVEQFGRRIYELQTNTDTDNYTDLAQLIAAINAPNNTTYAGNIDALFNVDGFLRMLALDIFAGHWDSYSYNTNNYYLYHNLGTGKFEFIPYDTDNTFGIDWFGIDWAQRNVYSWTPESDFPPLTTRILGVLEFRRRFTYYLHTLLQTAANPATFFPRIDSLHTLITPFAEADTLRVYDYGFTIADFHDSYDNALGAHVTYGIKLYITTRRNSAIAQLNLQNIAPIIIDASHLPALPVGGQSIHINALVFDDATATALQVWLYYRINGGSFISVPMYDDGISADEYANDGIFGTILSDVAAPAFIEYYLSATDVAGAANREPLAENAYRQVSVVQGVAHLTINEFMASNHTVIADEFGEFNDWIELYNAGTTPINLHNFYLTDNLNQPHKWQLPDTLLAAQAFMLIWADSDTAQGTQHANFKLNATGEQIAIFDALTQPVYTLHYGVQQADLSQGLLPDGAGDLQNLANPTPGYSNMSAVGIPTLAAILPFRAGQIYPNPFYEQLTLPVELDTPALLRIVLYNHIGTAIFALPERIYPTGRYAIGLFPPAMLPAGIYYVKMTVITHDSTQTIAQKVLKW